MLARYRCTSAGFSRPGRCPSSRYQRPVPRAPHRVESLGDRIAALRARRDWWWFRWEPVVAVTVAALFVLGLGLLFTGVVPFGDRVPVKPAVPPAVAGPTPPAADSSTSGSTRVTPEPLAVQPGGPAVGSPAEDRVLHAFGPVPVGSTSPPLVLAVTNLLAYPVEVRAVATRSASFTIQDDACTTAVLQPRTTCHLAVVFVPTSAGDARSPIAVRLRQVCTSSVYWPCNAAESRIQSGAPDGARTVLPSGQVAVDWTTALNDGLNSLFVEGTTV